MEGYFTTSLNISSIAMKSLYILILLFNWVFIDVFSSIKAGLILRFKKSSVVDKKAVKSIIALVSIKK